jgi:hypothetical protein
MGWGSKTTSTTKKINNNTRMMIAFVLGLLHLNRKPKKLISICSSGLFRLMGCCVLDIVSAFIYMCSILCPASGPKGIQCF